MIVYVYMTKQIREETMFNPKKFTSDGTILQVTFGKGPDTNKYMKYIKEGMLHKTYTVKVIDNRIYEPRQIGGFPESILATKMIDSSGIESEEVIEVIYPRDHIVKVNE